MLLQLCSWKTLSNRRIVGQPKKPFLIELPASYPELLVNVHSFLQTLKSLRPVKPNRKVLVNLKTRLFLICTKNFRVVNLVLRCKHK